MVPAKGRDPHAIKMVVREVKISGYSRLIIKADQEPSILALLDAAKKEKLAKSSQSNRKWANTSLMGR